MQNPTAAATTRLVGYVAGLLPHADWHVARGIADRAAENAATVSTLDSSSPDSTDSESGLPRVLASTARAAVRAYLSPWTQLDAPAAPRAAVDQLDTVLRELRATDGPPPPPHLSAAA